MAVTTSVMVEVVSDTVCPWCWVGKRRLEQALRLLGDAVAPTVVWRPFQLNPRTPAEGVDRERYLAEKYGLVRVRQMHEVLTETAAADGLAMNFGAIKTIPNTFDSHRLIWSAGTQQDAVVEALFKAYFTDGQDIGQAAVLDRIAQAAGVAPLSPQVGRREVQEAIEKAYRMGISGVPSFFANGHFLTSGAQPAEVLAKAIEQSSHLPATGTVCGPDGCSG